jgi:hypothetical protein
MVVAFERGKAVCEVGGDAVAFARELRAEFPDAIVAILPARRSWEGGWPW